MLRASPSKGDAQSLLAAVSVLAVVLILVVILVLILVLILVVILVLLIHGIFLRILYIRLSREASLPRILGSILRLENQTDK